MPPSRLGRIPPGLIYLSKQIPRILAPAASCYLARIILYRFCDIAIPTWLAVLAYIFSGPLVLTVFVQYYIWKDRREASAAGAVLAPNLPGWIGGLDLFTVNVENMFPGDHLAVGAAELGYTFGLRFLFKTRLFTAEPDHLRVILATEFNSFEKGPEFRDAHEPLLGTGVFAADGEMWKFHRQMTRPFFHRERISDFDLFESLADKAVTQIKARLREGYPVDMQDMVARFTLDAATSFMFARDMQSIAAPMPYPHYVPSSTTATATIKPHAVAAAFRDAQLVTASRYRLGEHWPLSEFWKDELTGPVKIIHEYLDPILEEAIAKKRAEEREGKGKTADEAAQEGQTLLDHLLTFTEDRTILRDEILSISVAGRDTTASLLSFTLYMLSQNPHILSKLRSEILRIVGPSRRPTFADFRDLKYLRAVLNETLRLYPAVPLNARTPLYPTVLQPKNGGRPIYIPAGTRTLVNKIVMHRRTDLWGPDALTYDPDRFLDERLHKYLIPNPFIFLPFSAGPRICLGQQFAYHEASFFLVALLQTFSAISLSAEAQPPAARPPAEWKTNDKSGWKAHEKIRPRAHMTMFVRGGLWVTMEEAEKDV
ncbi:cytochrome P450 [Roridomyces roridus]|uniref:Cytochrome P450 n=1 Tax=Roridomyces roridus TaxID=1738132 RepID=A0AAD7FC40_9AGAR|nr:cytochrome P450 [Roridomyces roridus]